MKKRNIFSKGVALLMSLTLLVPLLSACMQGDNTDDNQERVLRIATYYGVDDDYFSSRFTDIFEYAHPNIKIELVSYNDDYRFRFGPMKPGEKPKDPLENLKELMNGPNPPDVVIVNYPQYLGLVEENLLTPLDSKITSDKMDLNEFVPSVINALKAAGNDQLYALAPTFSGWALLYNKKLFADAGVNPPTADMTWDDLFNLARLMSKGEGDQRVYGFSFSPYSDENPFYDLGIYTAPLQLSIVDENGEKMTVDSGQWASVWETVAQLVKDNVLPKRPEPPRDQSPENFNPFFHDHFLSGRVAMTIAHYSYINQIIEANRYAQNIQGFTPVEWDAVPLPTHPEAPGVGGNVSISIVMGINNKAQNPDDAWEYIKFINSDEWARLKAKSNYEMVTRKKYIQPREGLSYNVEAFYALTPPPVSEFETLFAKNPELYRVNDIGFMKFKEVLDGQKTVQDALKAWQTEGDAVLQEIKKNQENPNSGGAMMDNKAVPMPVAQ